MLKRQSRQILIFVLIFGLPLLLSGLFFLYLNLAFTDRFFPNTKIAGVDVSNQKKTEVISNLEQKEKAFQKTLTLKTAKEKQKTTYTNLGFFSKARETVDAAFEKGRVNSSLIPKLLDQANIVINGYEVPLKSDFDPEIFDLYAEEKLANLTKAPTENSLALNNFGFKKVLGEPGTALHKKALFARLKNQVENLNNLEVALPIVKAYPRVDLRKTQKARQESTQIAGEKVTLSFEEKTWSLEPKTLKTLVTFTATPAAAELNPLDYLAANNFDPDKFIMAHYQDSKKSAPNNLATAKNTDSKKVENFTLKAVLEVKKTGDFLNAKIAPAVNVKPQNARFKIKNDNTLEILEDSKKGRELVLEKNITALDEISRTKKGDQRKITLATKEKGAEISAANINELGIKELIATGESNFLGSPTNRRKNIEVAAGKLDGVLIKPGETYSLLENIGEVSEATGYLPELVIKPGKTIKEFGGGLCQIGTTMFRAAMNSGLKVVERQWHSYPVQYYDPQGTDATIYQPSPDLKFVNDTENYLLIQSEIKGNILKFKFYGTKDGRTVRFEGPSYWDQGWAGNGSFRAKWTQIVKMPNGEERKKTFYSFYKSPELYH